MKDISSSGSSGFRCNRTCVSFKELTNRPATFFAYLFLYFCRGIMDGDGFWFENINSFSDITLIHDYMFATLEEEWLQGYVFQVVILLTACNSF